MVFIGAIKPFERLVRLTAPSVDLRNPKPVGLRVLLDHFVEGVLRFLPVAERVFSHGNQLRTIPCELASFFEGRFGVPFMEIEHDEQPMRPRTPGAQFEGSPERLPDVAKAMTRAQAKYGLRNGTQKFCARALEDRGPGTARPVVMRTGEPTRPASTPRYPIDGAELSVTRPSLLSSATCSLLCERKSPP